MLSLSQAIAFELDHPAYHLRGLSTARLLVAAAEDGCISLCRFTAEPSISRLSAPGKIAAVSPHPSRPLLALATKLWTQGYPRSARGDPGKLYVLGFDGSPIFEEAAPRPSEESPKWMTGGYTDCQFDESGTYLLCAANVCKDKVEIQLRETDRWSVVSRVVVTDPFVWSYASFHSTARSDTWALWLDGNGVYWVTRDGGSLRAMIEPCLADKLPPEFLPRGGDEFLTMDCHGIALERYRYSPAELLGVCEIHPFGTALDPFGTSLCYLDGSWALACSPERRIAVVDTRSMRVVDELAIEGHEPRPIEEYDSQLDGDWPLCTDISHIARIGDYLIVRHPLHRPLKLGLEDVGAAAPDNRRQWRDGMLCFPVSYVLDRPAT